MRRKQYLDWLSGALGIIGTSYGGFMLAWHLNHGNGINVLAMILLILGIVSLCFFIPLMTSRYIVSKQQKNRPTPAPEEKTEQEPAKTEQEPAKTEEKQEEAPQTEEEDEEEEELIPMSPRERAGYDYTSSRPSYSYSSYSTVYVKLVGYGPMLRVEGPQLLDMRNNTYYRIEDNMVYEEGYGPRFEIRGNQIRDAFGGYLFELSGSNINKVYGGFYASISGNYITVHDLSRKYEMTDSLSKKQLLAVAALLFDK